MYIVLNWSIYLVLKWGIYLLLEYLHSELEHLPSSEKLFLPMSISCTSCICIYRNTPYEHYKAFIEDMGASYSVLDLFQYFYKQLTLQHKNKGMVLGCTEWYCNNLPTLTLLIILQTTTRLAHIMKKILQVGTITVHRSTPAKDTE
jgi:hypothetical protein